jgi:hypothetical protein
MNHHMNDYVQKKLTYYISGYRYNSNVTGLLHIGNIQVHVYGRCYHTRYHRSTVPCNHQVCRSLLRGPAHSEPGNIYIISIYMGQPYKLGTFDNQGCTYDSWFLAWSSKKKHHPYSSDNNNADPTGKSFPRGTGWLWRPFWRNGWWNLCNPHIMWSDCSWKKQSRRLWKSDSINLLSWFKGTSMLQCFTWSCYVLLVFYHLWWATSLNKWPANKIHSMDFPWYSHIVHEPLPIWRRFTNIIGSFIILSQ